MNLRIGIAVPVLAAASLACSIFLGGPAYPEPPIPISSEAAEGLQTIFQEALEAAAQTGSLTVHITESELTSYMAAKLSEESDPVITEPQVSLRDGVMKVFGKARTGIFVANVSFTTEVSIDPAGQPQIDITEASYGPVAAPSSLVEALGAFLRETLTGSVGPAALGFRLESISIGDGTMTLSGRIK